MDTFWWRARSFSWIIETEEVATDLVCAPWVGGFSCTGSLRLSKCRSLLACIFTWHICSLCLFFCYTSRRKKPPRLFSYVSLAKQMRKEVSVSQKSTGLFAGISAMPGARCSHSIAQRQLWPLGYQNRQELMGTFRNAHSLIPGWFKWLGNYIVCWGWEKGFVCNLFPYSGVEENTLDGSFGVLYTEPQLHREWLFLLFMTNGTYPIQWTIVFL